MRCASSSRRGRAPRRRTAQHHHPDPVTRCRRRHRKPEAPRPPATSTEGESMIAALIALCVRNRLLVLMLTTVLVGLGIWSTASIRLDAIPDLSDVQVIVVTEYPGQNPEVVDNQV